MGEHYDPACELEDTYLLTRDFAEYEAQLVEENDYWSKEEYKDDFDL